MCDHHEQPCFELDMFQDPLELWQEGEKKDDQKELSLATVMR